MNIPIKKIKNKSTCDGCIFLNEKKGVTQCVVIASKIYDLDCTGIIFIVDIKKLKEAHQ